MHQDWSDKLKRRIVELERQGRVLSSAACEANAEAERCRDAFREEKKRRIEAEQKAHALTLENVRLVRENKQLQAEFIEQRKLQDSLYRANKKVVKLEKQLNKRSSKEEPYGLNTPSSKLLYKTNTSEDNRSRKGGAKPGHSGHGRKSFTEEEADQIIYLPDYSEQCDCGGRFTKGESVRHSVYSFIPARLEKHVYFKNKFTCSKCHKKILPSTPGVMPGNLYGNGIIAHILTEIFYHGQTIGKMAKRFKIGIGAICGFAHRMASFLKPLIDVIIHDLRLSKLIHADETTWSNDGKKGYAWFFGNNKTKLFVFRHTRSSDVPKDIIGTEPLDLVLITDRYRGYIKALKVLRQYCYAHLLRDVISEMEDFPNEQEVQTFCSELSSQLKEAMQLRNKGYCLEKYLQEADKIKTEIIRICDSSGNHPSVQHIQNIFRDYSANMYQWANDPDIPADNNFAERENRFIVISRKISFGSQAERGLATREVLMSVLHTAKARGYNPERFLQKALNMLALDKNANISQLLNQA